MFPPWSQNPFWLTPVTYAVQAEAVEPSLLKIVWQDNNFQRDQWSRNESPSGNSNVVSLYHSYLLDFFSPKILYFTFGVENINAPKIYHFFELLERKFNWRTFLVWSLRHNANKNTLTGQDFVTFLNICRCNSKLPDYLASISPTLFE